MEKAVELLELKHEPDGWCDRHWEKIEGRLRNIEVRIGVIVTVAAFLASLLATAIGKKI